MKNQTIVDFTRKEIKEGLHKLNDGCRDLFKRLYAHNHPLLSIDEVVDHIQPEKLEWALTQVQNSLKNPTLLM